MEKAENTDQKRPDKKIRNIFQQFRDSLDELMLPAMHRRVLLYGYEPQQRVRTGNLSAIPFRF